MNDGIIVVRIEPDNSLEIITLSGNSGEAIRQIAEIMGYPPDDPLCAGDLASVYNRDFRTFNTGVFNPVTSCPSVGRLHLYHVSPHWGNFRPEDATLEWYDSSAQYKGMPVNYMASHVPGSGDKPSASIWGRAVLTGFDLETVTIRSVSLRRLQHDLAMQAYAKASDHVRAWAQGRGM